MACAFPLLPRRVRLRLKARWSRQLLAALGVRLQSAGPAPTSGLLVANHISWLDIFAINAVAPAAFVSKDDVRRWPAIGWLAARTETIFLERGSRSAAQRTREHVVAELGAGRLIGLFPEGTTTFGDELLPFHSALFQSAIDAASPVTPLALLYSDRDGQLSRAAAYVGDTHLGASLLAIARASGLTARAEVLPTLAAAGADRRHLAHRAHTAIAHALRHPLVAGAGPSTLSGVTPSR